MVYDLPAAGKRLVQRARGYVATVEVGRGGARARTRRRGSGRAVSCAGHSPSRRRA